jgi:hypothetical protein
VEIYGSTFESNTANKVSALVIVSRTFLKILPRPGGEHATFHVQCSGGSNVGNACSSDADCPRSYCVASVSR